MSDYGYPSDKMLEDIKNWDVMKTGIKMKWY